LQVSASNGPSDPNLAHHQENTNRRKILCFCCLAIGHISRLCTGQIICRHCYNYDHIARNCLSRLFKGKYLWRKVISQPNNTPDSPVSTLDALTPSDIQSPTHVSETLYSDQSTSPSCCSPDMVNYPCDLFPHVPAGMVAIQPRLLRT
jgi:hypothetical protein